MRRRAAALPALTVLLALTACAPQPGRYAHQFLGAFDTLFELTAFTETREQFDAFAADFEARVGEYHRQFDIYHEYEGINNLKTVNDYAGIAPVPVDGAVRELLTWWQGLDPALKAPCNILLGPALALWRDARERSLDDPEHAAVPDSDALEALRGLCTPDKLVIDETAGTVYLTEPGCALDVGAIAKGWACARAVREAAAARGVTSYLLNAGGNVIAGDGPRDGRPRWGVGLRDPDAADRNRDVLYVREVSVVTSGDYQRYYVYQGRRLGHILDPETLQPAERFRAVTVVGPDSGLCDALSTALFVLPEDEGAALAERLNCDAVWMRPDGSVHRTPGAEAVSQSAGAKNG
jgi:thiamine biosynthesis lipoprotein